MGNIKMQNIAKYLVVFFCLITFYLPCFAQSNIIVTVVGGGTSGCGDGGAATVAELGYPIGVAVDASGNLYIAEQGNNRIRKVNTSGIISLIAGNGTAGYSGDGGAATLAQLNSPMSVAVDASGNVYIADANNKRIRIVTSSGIISTFAGDGTLGYSGDGGAATLAQIGFPIGVAVDASGNVYIADYNNNRIRKVTSIGIISTFAGNGPAGYSGDGGAATLAQLNSPWSVAVDASGNVYIADGSNIRIRKVTSSGIISTIAGNGTAGYSGDGGAATLAQIGFPIVVAVDASGNVYIADAGNNRIRKVTSSGIISTIAGNGTGFSGDGGAATLAQLNYSSSVAVDASGNVYIADAGNNRIRKVTSSGIINTFAGNGLASFGGEGGAATLAQLFHPSSVTVDASGNVYIADNGNHRIRKENISGIISTIAGNGTAGYSGDGGMATLAQLSLDYGSFDKNVGVTVDASGNLYIADAFNNRIRKVTSSGIISTIAGSGTAGYSGDGGAATLAQLYYPSGVALDASGTVYIADASNNRIRKVTSSGIISTIAGNGTIGYSGDGGAATLAQLYSPLGVAVDASGNVYIADNVNSRIRKVTSSGTISTIAGNGTAGYSGDGGASTLAQLYYPSSIAVDASGNVYIADVNNSRIRKVTSSGIISTIAGNVTTSYSGDGGAATLAQLNSPTSVALDASGNVLIADSYNNRIRMIVANLYAITGSTTSLCVGDTTTMHEIASTGVWSSSNTAIAAVNSSGLVTGVSSGVSTISYTLGGVSATKAITVLLTPSPITGNASLCIGGTTSLSVATGGGIWSSNNTTIATINSTGLVTAGSFLGTAIITYLLSTGCNATYAISVNPTPPPISGTLYLCEGSTTSLTDATSGGTWSSSNSSVATINSTTGLVNGITAGNTSISYSIGGLCSVGEIITVNPLPAPITGSPTLCVSSAITLSDGTSSGTWISSNSSVATINSSSGVVTGVLPGTTIISYVLSTGCGVAYPITVNALPLPITGTASLCENGTTSLTDATSGGTWSSTNTTIATINSLTGVVSGIAPGTATISYLLSTGCSVAETITVNPLPATITGFDSLCKSATNTLSDITSGGTWSSSNTAIATITGSSGVVTGINGGSTTITYMLSTGCSTTHTITVQTVPLPITGITSMSKGSTITLSDATFGGTWSSSNSAIATINSTGVVSSFDTGSTTISYTNFCGSATTLITVKSIPYSITGITSLCIGSTTILADSTTGGVWSSSNSGVASIGSSTGLVTGISAGIANISYSVAGTCLASITVTVNIAMMPGAITGHRFICLNTPDTLYNILSGGIWGSQNNSIVSIDAATGIAQGNAPGTTTIFYSVCGGFADYTIMVLDTPHTITGIDTLCLHGNTILYETNHDGFWVSSNNAVATVTQWATNCVVSGESIGTATITYKNGCGTPATYAVTVYGTISSNVGDSVICTGNTFTYTNPSGGGLWSSSSAVDNINSTTGVFTATNQDIVLIFYSQTPICRAATIVTVNGVPSEITGIAKICTGNSTTLYNNATGGLWSSSNATIAPVISLNDTCLVYGYAPGGNATITYNNGCSAASTQIVTVSLTSPPANITRFSTSPPLPLCNTTLFQNFGDTDILSDDIYYRWSVTPTSNTIFPQAGNEQYCIVNFNNIGTTYVSLFLSYSPNFNDCISIASVSVSVSPATTNFGNPYIGYFTDYSQLLCLSDILADSYQWGYDSTTLKPTFITGETFQSYYCPSITDSTANRYYWVEITKDNCSQKVYFNPPPLGTTNTVIYIKDGLLVYPNPSTGNFSIRLPQYTNAAVICINDIAGKEIYHQAINERTNKIVIQLSQNIKSGNYLLNVKTDLGSFHKLISVE